MTSGAPPLLMTPGPTRIPEQVLRAGCVVLHHRTPEFSDALGELISRLRRLFGATAADVLPVHATGRAGMEGAMLNFLAPGEAVVSCCNGAFGEMWAGFGERHGLDVIRVALDWQAGVDPAQVARALEANPGARAVTVVHSDTSTGVLNPVDRIAEVARAHGALVMVDAISALGGAPFRFDEWGVDVAVTSSQKCLMSSPGISFVAVSPGAWERADRVSRAPSYLDFRAIRAALDGPRPQTPGTTPVGLVLQVLEATRMIDREGPVAVFERHRRMADRLRSWARERELGLLGDSMEARSPSLTVLQVPTGVAPESLRTGLRRRGIQIAVGMGAFVDTCVRVGHMGDIRPDDVERTIQEIDDTLEGMGR